jgi:hypothetical protein
MRNTHLDFMDDDRDIEGFALENETADDLRAAIAKYYEMNDGRKTFPLTQEGINASRMVFEMKRRLAKLERPARKPRDPMWAIARQSKRATI